MRSASRQRAPEDVTLEPESDGLTEAVARSNRQHGTGTWNSLSMLASEYAHAVLDAVLGDRVGDRKGHVEHECNSVQRLEPQSTTQSDPYSRTGCVLPVANTVHERHGSSRQNSLADSGDVVRKEAARVKAKFASVDASTEVVLRFDFMNEYDTRVASGAILAATLVGLAVLIAQFTKKMSEDSSTARFRHNATSKWSIGIGCVCLAVLSANLGVFAWRVMQARRLKKIWKVRRKRNATLFSIEAAVQSVNLVFYIVPNIYLLKEPCYFFGPVVFWCGWVRWTCWNILFLLFLVHAYGARTWKVPQEGSRRLLAPGEAAFQPPQGQRQLIMDGPWHLNWPCLIPWLLMEAAHTIAWLRNATASGFHMHSIETVVQLCKTGGALPECRADRTTKISIDMIVVVAILYFALTCYILMYKLRQYMKQPYEEIQVAVVFYRLQLRLRTTVMTFFGLSLILLWIVKLNSCASFQFSWLGLTPMQVVMTANAFVWSYIAMPHTPQEQAVAMRVWEQEFAWIEADKPVMVAARALTVPGDHKLNKQPIFCFETMMHMLYWSSIVYDYKRGAPQSQQKPARKRMSPSLISGSPNLVSGSQSLVNESPNLLNGSPSLIDGSPSLVNESPSLVNGPPSHQPVRTTLNLRTALGLYNLTDSELFWELQLDTRCLMGWSDSTIVVAFRGTASMKNALSDLQAWRVTHPPARGHTFCGTRPMVHVGFMKSWLAGGFNFKVINRIMQLVNSCKAGADKLKILVTGHSLGGALATLAAYDIRKQLQEAGRQSVEVVCYSFGAPRTGNHAFARDYNHVVPDTWSIINGQDIVTRGAKFLFLYKRPGKRVIVNDLGRLMVSPTSMEASVQQSTAGQSMDHHFLTSYHHAIMSTVLAQFSNQGFLDGMEGIVKLVEASPYLQTLLATQMDMSLEAMRQWRDLAPSERGTQNLPGAHLPVRGFYRIKSITSGQLQKQKNSGLSLCGIPFWLAPRSENTSAKDLVQPDMESELVSQYSAGQSDSGTVMIRKKMSAVKG
ncbi:hypothetical protein WJX77_003952 [Trebouxia sp. C0004]